MRAADGNTAPSAASRSLRLHDFALLGVVVALLIAGMVLKGDRFLSYANMMAVLTQASVVGVLAVGMTFVIASAGIDLSVGSVVAAAAVAGGQLADQNGMVFLLCAIGAGAVIGAINGAAVAYGRVVPFIATLAMLTIARGFALWASDKTPISVLHLDAVRWFGAGKILSVPVPVIVFLLVTAIGWVLLNQTLYGRYVVAVSSNREAARIAGVRIRRVLFATYVLSGLCAGLAAALLTGRLASASPVVGTFYELDAIAAVVIGGTSLRGGKSSMVGTLLGVLTFAVIFNLLTLLDMAIEIQQIVKGLIILAAVLIQRKDT